MIRYFGCNIARETFVFKIVNEYVTIRVAAVLETLVGGFICGIKLFERSLSKKWLIPRVFVYFFVYLQKNNKRREEDI